MRSIMTSNKSYCFRYDGEIKINKLSLTKLATIKMGG